MSSRRRADCFCCGRPRRFPLRNLKNCIIFSQQGLRDLPLKLSGGNLDEDLFHIIHDQRLIPDPGFICEPADFAPAIPNNLVRPVEANEIVDFFIEFVINDKLGQISNIHKIRADRSANGTRGPDCMLLAKLASDAVDFSKSGVPVSLPNHHSFSPKLTSSSRPTYVRYVYNFLHICVLCCL
jgi:hypothetical protein